MFFQLKREGKTDKEAIYIVESKIYKNGVLSLQIAAVTGRSAMAAVTGSVGIAGGAMFAPATWAFYGIIFAAQTISDNRKVKHGLMTKAEAKKRRKRQGTAIGGGMIGSSTGAATGFIAGTMVCPGIGSLVGCMAGAIAGGLLGQKIALKILSKFEDDITEITKTIANNQENAQSEN